jgi:RNA recognition motif-containing protein
VRRGFFAQAFHEYRQSRCTKNRTYMKKKLYVGNLSFQTTETELKELFSRSGPVETVRIITDRDTGRSKGFAFIEMEEGADDAIAQLNGKEFNGRVLTVNETRAMSPRDSADGKFKRY